MSVSNSQGFVATGSAARAGVRAEQTVAQKFGTKTASRAGEGSRAVVEGGALTHRPVEDPTLKRIHKVKGRLESIYLLDMLSFLTAGVLLPFKVGPMIGRFTIAPAEALRNAKRLTEIPAEYMKSVAKQAREAALLKDARLQVKPAEFTWNPVQAIQNKRARSKAIKELLKDVKPMEADLSVLQGAQKHVTMATNAEAKVASLTTSGEAMSAKIAAQTGKVTTPLKTSIREGLQKIDKTGFGSGFQKLTSSLPKFKWLDSIRGKGMTELAGAANRSVKNMSVFGKVVWVASLLGVGAAVITHRKENHQTANELKEIESIVGQNNPLLLNIMRTNAKQGLKHVASTGLTAAAEITNGILFGSHEMAGGGSMKLVFAQMMMPTLGTVLNKNNPALNAYSNLQLADQGKLAQTPQDRVLLVRQLAAYTPSVSMASGTYNPAAGYYNKLNAQVAEAIVEKNMSTREIVQLLGNNEKFTALAAEVDAKKKAEAAEAKAAEGKAEAPAAQAEAAKEQAPAAETAASTKTHTLHKDATKEIALGAIAEDTHQGGHEAYHGAHAPSHKISGIVPQGKLIEQHKAATM